MSSDVLFPSGRFEHDVNKALEEQLRILRRENLSSMQGGGRPKSSSPYAQPSFFQRLRSVDDSTVLVSPSMADVFPPEDFTAFSLFHSIETDHAQALFRGESYSEMIKGGLLQRIWTWIRGFDHIPNADHREYDVAIPVGELHVPNVPDAKAFFTFKQSLKEETTLSVSIAGLGAGGSISREIGFQSDLEGIPGKCVGLVCKADILITRWENSDDHRVLNLVEEIELDPWVFDVPLEMYPALDKAEDICTKQNAYSLLWERVRKLKLRRRDDFHTTSPSAGGKNSYTIKVENSDEYYAKCLLPVKALGVDVGCEVKSHYTESTEFKYQLPPLYDYIAAYSGAGRQPLTWGAKKMTLSIEDGMVE
jgi:hypothetical protein